jgi:transcriptional/translational regulatory protein YebC/TACO1
LYQDSQLASAQLAVLAAAAVVAAESAFLLVAFGLAGYSQAHARHSRSRLIDRMDELDDVQTLYHNAELAQ